MRHPHHKIATRAFELLPARGHTLHIVPQNLFELWVVATRPVEQNGLGMSADKALVELARLKNMFALLPDKPAIYGLWGDELRKEDLTKMKSQFNRWIEGLEEAFEK